MCIERVNKYNDILSSYKMSLNFGPVTYRPRDSSLKLDIFSLKLLNWLKIGKIKGPHWYIPIDKVLY